MPYHWADDPTIHTIKSQVHAQSAQGEDHTRPAGWMPNGRPRAPWENLRDVGGGCMRQMSGRTGDSSAEGHGRGKTRYRTTERRTYEALRHGLEALM